MTVFRASRFATTLAASLLTLAWAATAHAQGNTPPASTPAASAQPPSSPDAGKADSLALDSAPPVNAEEDGAIKSFQEVPNTDAPKKIELGEAFVQKYPNSRYLPVVYSTLTLLYLQTNQVQKMEDVGDKEVKLTPNDVQTMAILAQTIPRAMGNATSADGVKELAKAEDYSKRAIDVTPTIVKPANISEEQFASAKNAALAMAHGGLGLIYLKRGKVAEAIPELDQAVKIDPSPDPVNYYLLGLANEKASHFTDAEAAYSKCAALQSSMQNTCKSKAEEAKKLGNTQLSVPK
jgi:tetratricopeptide (TPR) repeat protein